MLCVPFACFLLLVEFVMSLQPLCLHAAAIRAAAGAIVNVANRHWVALPRAQGSVWLLDSMDEP